MSDAITNEDSFVEKRAKIGIFPVSEVRVFPQRRPQTSWEVGLRQYDPSNDLYNKPLRRTKTDTKDNDDRLEVHTPVDSPSRPASAKMLHQHSFAEIKRLQYASPTKLVALTDDVKDRYFGDVAIEKYHETYRELVDHGKLMLGGYDELHEITKQEEPTVLNYAMDSLLADGVLTPRDEQLSRHSPKYKMKPQKGIRDMQVDLTIDINRRTGRTISDDSAQQVRFKTGELAIESKPSIDERETQDSVSPLRPSRKSIGSSLSKLRLNDDPDSVLNDYSYEDRGGQPTYGLSSPRAIFLSGCLKYNLPPRTQVMVRKQISSTINLAHMGIGNTCAVVLAEAVPFIPHLQVLNLCDNALEDSGLSAIIRAIAKHKTIEILDISQNTIDEDAADALADFIGTPDCYLQCLRMSNANIDDGECARFVDVLMHNCHLKELDMSNNLLGKDENLNAVQPDFVTGGESLAELIRIGSCPIQTLNLHWNMIRLEGAEVLCDSIRSNIHLTDLDLSYNALGSAAACVLGAALMENRTIQKLNLANNGIDAVGCFTLFVGLRENASLHDLVIDGNPIGEQGARIMMKIAAEYGHRLQISAKTCDFKAKSSQTKFLIENPCGEYVLDMSHPYDRAIAFEMFDIATKDTSLDINSIEITESNPGPLAKSRPASPSGDGASSKLKPKATAAAQDVSQPCFLHLF